MRMRVRPYIRIPGCAFEAVFGALFLLVLGVVYVIQQAPVILQTLLGK